MSPGARPEHRRPRVPSRGRGPSALRRRLRARGARGSSAGNARAVAEAAVLCHLSAADAYGNSPFTH